MAQLLDCRGLQCPEPVTRCRDLIKNNSVQEIEVIVDNPAALENVTRFLTKNGYSASSLQKSDVEWIIKASGTGAGIEEQAIQKLRHISTSY